MAGGFNPFPHVGALPFPLQSGALHTTYSINGRGRAYEFLGGQRGHLELVRD
jgi:hypothetical protein